MPPLGTIALVGAGEFLEPMRPVDGELLERSGGRRVVILPTASAPDGPGVPERWADLGLAHFRTLGAEPVAVMALDRAGCQAAEHVEAVRRADLVYFSGGKPGHLLASLRATPLWGAVLEVLARGGVVAGCSAGAMVLGGWIPGGPILRLGSFWQPAFSLAPGAVVLPHFNEMPRAMLNLAARMRPRGSYVLGIDSGTALVGNAEGWQVRGRGRVVVRRADGTASFSAGSEVPL